MQLHIHQSGRVTMEIAGIHFDISSGVPRQQYQHVACTMSAGTVREADRLARGNADEDDDMLHVDSSSDHGRSDAPSTSHGTASAVDTKKLTSIAFLDAVRHSLLATMDLESLLSSMARSSLERLRALKASAVKPPKKEKKMTGRPKTKREARKESADSSADVSADISGEAEVEGEDGGADADFDDEAAGQVVSMQVDEGGTPEVQARGGGGTNERSGVGAEDDEVIEETLAPAPAPPAAPAPAAAPALKPAAAWRGFKPRIAPRLPASKG